MRITRRKLLASIAALPVLRVPYVLCAGQFEGDPEEWRRAMTVRPVYEPMRISARECLPDGNLGPLETVEVSCDLSDEQLQRYRDWRIAARRKRTSGLVPSA